MSPVKVPASPSNAVSGHAPRKTAVSMRVHWATGWLAGGVAFMRRVGVAASSVSPPATRYGTAGTVQGGDLHALACLSAR